MILAQQPRLRRYRDGSCRGCGGGCGRSSGCSGGPGGGRCKAMAAAL